MLELQKIVSFISILTSYPVLRFLQNVPSCWNDLFQLDPNNECLLSSKSAARWVLCICRCYFIWSTYFVHESSTIVAVFKRYKYFNTASLEICHIKESDKQLLFSALHQSPSAKHDFFMFVTFKVWQPSKPPLLSICEKSTTTTLPDKVWVF